VVIESRCDANLPNVFHILWIDHIVLDLMGLLLFTDRCLRFGRELRLGRCSLAFGGLFYRLEVLVFACVARDERDFPLASVSCSGFEKRIGLQR
jgi:hypothetical protein